MSPLTLYILSKFIIFFKIVPYNSKKIVIFKILINKCNRIYRRKYKKDISIDEYNLEKYIILNGYKDVENDLSFYSLLKNLNYKERIILHGRIFSKGN